MAHRVHIHVAEPLRDKIKRDQCMRDKSRKLYALDAGDYSFIPDWSLELDSSLLVLVKPEQRSVYAKDVDNLGQSANPCKLEFEPVSVASGGDGLWCTVGRNPSSGTPVAMLSYDGQWEALKPQPDWSKFAGHEFWNVIRGRQKGQFFAVGANIEQRNYVLATITPKGCDIVNLPDSGIDCAPARLAIEPAGQSPDWLYLATGDGGSVDVWRFDEEGPLGQVSAALSGPPGLVPFKPVRIKPLPIGGTGRFWVSSFNIVVQGNREGAWSKPLEVTTPSDTVNDIVFAPQGRALYATCTYSNRVAVLDMGKTTKTTKTTYFENVERPWLVKARGNHVYVLQQGSGQETITDITVE